MVQQVLEAEMTSFLSADSYERTRERTAIATATSRDC